MTTGSADAILSPDLPDLLSSEMTGRVLGISAQTVRRMAREGEIPAVRVGERKWAIPKAMLAQWIVGSCGGRINGSELCRD